MLKQPKIAKAGLAPLPIKRRMKPEERKILISQDAARLFASRGFADVGYRELAKFCDVSEPLLYRYFPKKEDLWNAALTASRNNAVSEMMASVVNQSPSTRALVECTLALACEFCRSSEDIRTQNRNALHRMVLRSLAEDGAFAKVVTVDLSTRLSKFVADCLNAAEASGDLAPMEFQEQYASGEFYVNLFFMVGAMRLPKPSARNLKLSEDELITYLIWHQLRALGFSEALIRKELKAIKGARSERMVQIRIPEPLIDLPCKR